jgi:hypothetical protein
MEQSLQLELVLLFSQYFKDIRERPLRSSGHAAGMKERINVCNILFSITSREETTWET